MALPDVLRVAAAQAGRKVALAQTIFASHDGTYAVRRSPKLATPTGHPFGTSGHHHPQIGQGFEHASGRDSMARASLADIEYASENSF